VGVVLLSPQGRGAGGEGRKTLWFYFPIIKKNSKKESFLFSCKTHFIFYNERRLFCNNEKSMKFNNPLYEHEELTYEDVFIFQQYFEGKSRIHDVNITPKNKM
jgi:hypothetical protein